MMCLDNVCRIDFNEKRAFSAVTLAPLSMIPEEAEEDLLEEANNIVRMKFSMTSVMNQLMKLLRNRWRK